MRYERYQKGAEMLGSKVLAVRLAGIYALQRLAKEHLKEYHVQIMRLFCAFACYPTKDKKYEEKLEGEAGQLREDVQAIMDVIRKRDLSAIALENEARFIVDLPTVMLRFARLNDANLQHAIFFKANLSYARLGGANLSNAKLWGTKLIKTDLKDTNLTCADLSGLLYGPVPQPVTGLTQEQLNQACSDPNYPPDLRGVLDQAGNQLQWCGNDLNDRE